MTVKSADRPDTLVGAGLDGVVIDETGIIKEDAWKESIRPALSDKQGWAVFIGTPKGFNWFYGLYREAEYLPNWARWQRPSSDNPLMTEAELADARRQIGSVLFSQEYLAEFIADGLGVFRREWLPIVDGYPREAKQAVRYWDKAATSGGGDFSAGVLIAEYDGIWYVLDVIRGQWSSRERNVVINTAAKLDQQRIAGRVSIWIEQEGGSGGKESAEISVRELAGFDVHAERVTGEKETRWRPLAAQAEAGNVKLVAGAWNQAFIDELCVAHTDGSHDDQADAAAGAFNKLAKPKRRLLVSGMSEVKQ